MPGRSRCGQALGNNRLQGKTNFFEKRVGDYQKAGVMGSAKKDKEVKQQRFSFDEDF